MLLFGHTLTKAGKDTWCQLQASHWQRFARNHFFPDKRKNIALQIFLTTCLESNRRHKNPLKPIRATGGWTNDYHWNREWSWRNLHKSADSSATKAQICFRQLWSEVILSLRNLFGNSGFSTLRNCFEIPFRGWGEVADLADVVWTEEGVHRELRAWLQYRSYRGILISWCHRESLKVLFQKLSHWLLLKSINTFKHLCSMLIFEGLECIRFHISLVEVFKYQANMKDNFWCIASWLFCTVWCNEWWWEMICLSKTSFIEFHR